MLRYAISDRRLFHGKESERRSALIEQARRLAQSGAAYFQLREKDLPPRDLAGIARQILDVFRGSSAPTRLLINTCADVAAAVGAPGVHLASGPGQLAPRHIRELYRRCHLSPPLVSLSCHTLAEMEGLPANHPDSGADPRPDLILFGPVFGKQLRDSPHSPALPGTGLPLLQQAVRIAAPTPVFALGGVTPDLAEACVEAGAAGVAGIRMFL